MVDSRNVCGVTCMAIVVGAGAICQAQDRRSLGVDVGQVNVQPSIEPVDDARAEPARPQVELTRENRAFLARSTEMTADLERQGTLAFRRGLMPLPDYLNQLALSEYVDVRVANLANPQQRSAVYQRQVELLEDAFRRISSPVHRGQTPILQGRWIPGKTTNELLAGFAVKEARLKLAEADGDAGAAAALRAECEYLAREHFSQQGADYQIGYLAPGKGVLSLPMSANSLPTMAYSAKLSSEASLARAPEGLTSRTLVQDRQRYLNLILAQTRAWSSIDAGVGRADQVAAARLDVDLVTLGDDLAADPTALSAENVARVSRDCSELFRQQMEYYRFGTAKLFDLAQTWVAWHDVHHVATVNSPDAVAEADVAQRGDALSELQALADNVTDRRGRRSADVTFVQLAGRLDDLDELYGETDPENQYLP